MAYPERIVITGVGLTAPNANNLKDFREALLKGQSGISDYEIRYIGATHAGICDFPDTQYQSRKALRRGTRAGSISIYCAHEAVQDAGIELENQDRSRVGVYIGTTEHGNVETENEVFNISQYNYDVKFWTHHHNPRTIANNPAGEVTLNMGITGPHYCIGAACAAGNIGLIHGAQMLMLGEIDMAIAGGVSESIHTFGIFAGFKSQGALASHADPTKASRPFDKDRNGIVISEGGCLFTLERLSDALARKAPIYGELAGHAISSDAHDFVLPYAKRQTECMQKAIACAGLQPQDIDIINSHATSTPSGDVEECNAIRNTFAGCENIAVNNSKSMIGHCMGAAGSLELAGNLPAFEDQLVHPTINVDNIDPACDLPWLVMDTPKKVDSLNIILNNSFGMLGINSAVIIKRYTPE